MKETFLKGYWVEEDVWIYQHYEDQYAIRQIHVFPTKTVYLSVENPLQDTEFLDDQPLDIIDTGMVEFINREEFENLWNSRQL